jgi:hypothetical protein
MRWPTAPPNEKARKSNRTKPRSARALLSWQQTGLAEVLSGSAVARAVVAKIVRSRPLGDRPDSGAMFAAARFRNLDIRQFRMGTNGHN